MKNVKECSREERDKSFSSDIWILFMKEGRNLCPKNLTFPKAKREQ